MNLEVAVVGSGSWGSGFARLLARRGVITRLSIIEAKSLGSRQTLYVIGYERQRMLLASSPSGVSLLACLPQAQEPPEPPAQGDPSAFSDILRKVASDK